MNNRKCNIKNGVCRLLFFAKINTLKNKINYGSDVTRP